MVSWRTAACAALLLSHAPWGAPALEGDGEAEALRAVVDAAVAETRGG